jgi:hypothetical protein
MEIRAVSARKMVNLDQMGVVLDETEGNMSGKKRDWRELYGRDEKYHG